MKQNEIVRKMEYFFGLDVGNPTLREASLRDKISCVSPGKYCIQGHRPLGNQGMEFAGSQESRAEENGKFQRPLVLQIQT